MLNDLRFAVRSLLKSPGFTAIAVLTLAVGIGAAAAIYSALRALVLEPFSYPHQERIVQIWPHEGWAFGPEDFFDIRDQAQSFEAIGVYTPQPKNIGGERPQSVDGVGCTPGVLKAFGVVPALGRWLEDADEAKGAPHVAVISHALWQRSFGGDPGLVGRVVRIDGRDTTVVGIMPSGFEFAAPWMRSKTCQVWTPLQLERGGDRGSHWLSCIGRLKPGISIAAADAEIKAIGARLKAAYPDTNSPEEFFVRSLRVEMTRYVAPSAWMLFAAVVLVMLVACANVASMLLARGARRQAEFGIRVALGASRAQIIRMVLAESFVLAAASAVAGLGLASFGIRALVIVAQTTETRGQAMVIDAGVLAFAVGAAALTAVLAGLPPALVAFRLSVADASRSDSRSVSGSRTRQRLLRGLVVAQVAVAFALANIAALFSASYLKVLRANKDLVTEYVLSGELALHGAKYDTTEKRIRFNEQLVERVSALPGVSAAATTSKLPLEGGSNTNVLVNDEKFDPKVTGTTAEVSSVTPGYFAAQGLRLLKGRTLGPSDAGADNFGVVINRAMAEKCWAGRDPLGQTIRTNSPKPYFHAHVVGVVESVRQWGPKSDPNPEMYWTLDHAWGQTIYLIVRSPQPAALLTPLLRRELAAMDADLPLARVRTLGDVVRESTQGDRALADIVDFFMITALGLVAVGLYGTLSYQVLQRTREIGIRMAIGAERNSILGLVFRQGFVWVVVGLSIGAAVSLCIASALRSMIWGVDPINLLALAGSAIVVAAAAALASWVPAWRAARVDPIVALRFD